MYSRSFVYSIMSLSCARACLKAIQGSESMAILKMVCTYVYIDFLLADVVYI